MPNLENIRKWVDALRSGEYQQGHNRLVTVIDGEKKYCCLGVACEVARQNDVELRVTTYRPSSVGYNDEFNHLPSKVAEWLGIRVNPILTTTDPYEHSTASQLNDARHYSFEQIANAIELTYLTPPTTTNDEDTSNA